MDVDGFEYENSEVSMDSYEMEMLIRAEQVRAQSFLDLIEIKCREHCGMKRAWDDGLCHASEEMCCLVPHSPIWAGKAPLARPDAKADPQDFGDL